MKKIFAACGIVFLTFSFMFGTACSFVREREDTDEPVTENVSLEQFTKRNKDKTMYQLISSADSIFPSGPALTKDGLYQLVFTKDVVSGAENIVYTDFSNMHRVYLSSDVNSNHQNEGDTSYVPLSLGGSSILTDEKYIYVFEIGSLVLQKSEGEKAKPCIYRAKLDGSDRVKIEFPWNQSMKDSGGAFSDGESLYLLMYVVDEDTSTHTELIRADFSTLSTEPLIDFADVDMDLHNLSLVSSYEDKLVLSSLEFEDDGNIKKELYAVDPVEKTVEPLLAYRDDWYIFYQNGDINYINMNDNAVYRYDPVNGESTLFIPQVVPEGVEYESMQVGYNTPKPYISFRYSNENDEAVTYYWNCDTEEWKQATLMDGDREVSIYGIWKNYFLVMLQDKIVYYQDSIEGQSFTNQMYVTVYALIDQDDYWNGVPNYLYFEDDVYGN